MLQREKGNLSTLAELGYSPAGSVIDLSSVDESVIRKTREELYVNRQYVKFCEGKVAGYIWYNNLLEKWFGDVHVDNAYVETLVAVDLEKLVKSVQAIYCGSGHNGSSHNGFGHNGSSHNGSNHNGSSHNGSNHNGSNHNGSNHNGSGYNGKFPV